MIGVDHTIPVPISKKGKVGFENRTNNYYASYVGTNALNLASKIPAFTYLRVGRYTDDQGTEVDYTGDCIKLVESPSNNCQMTIIGAAYAILNQGFSREDRAEFFRILQVDYIGTRSLMVDIKSFNAERLEQVIEDNGYEIIFKTPYRNSTGSNMTVFYIDLNPKADEDDDDEGWDDDDD